MILSILECVKVENEDSASCQTSQKKKLKEEMNFIKIARIMSKIDIFSSFFTVNHKKI